MCYVVMKCFSATTYHRQTRLWDLYNLQPTYTFVRQLLHDVKGVKLGPSGRHIMATKHSGVKLSVQVGSVPSFCHMLLLCLKSYSAQEKMWCSQYQTRGISFFYGLYKELVTVTYLMMTSDT